jgi:hypothetical protein
MDKDRFRKFIAELVMVNDKRINAVFTKFSDFAGTCDATIYRDEKANAPLPKHPDVRHLQAVTLLIPMGDVRLDVRGRTETRTKLLKCRDDDCGTGNTVRVIVTKNKDTFIRLKRLTDARNSRPHLRKRERVMDPVLI